MQIVRGLRLLNEAPTFLLSQAAQVGSQLARLLIAGESSGERGLCACMRVAQINAARCTQLASLGHLVQTQVELVIFVSLQLFCLLQ